MLYISFAHDSPKASLNIVDILISAALVHSVYIVILALS